MEDDSKVGELLEDMENPDESLKESRKAAKQAEERGLEIHNVFNVVPERFSHMARMDKAAFSAKQKLEPKLEALQEYRKSEWYEKHHEDKGPKKEDWDNLMAAFKWRGEMIDHLMVHSHLARVTAEQLFDIVEYQEKFHDAEQVVKQVETAVEHLQKSTDKQYEMLERTMERLVDQNRDLQDARRKIDQKDDRIQELERRVAELQEE